MLRRALAPVLLLPLVATSLAPATGADADVPLALLAGAAKAETRRP